MTKEEATEILRKYIAWSTYNIDKTQLSKAINVAFETILSESNIVHCKDCFRTVPHWYNDPVSDERVISHFCTIVESDVEEYQYCWWGEDRKNVIYEWRDINGDGTAWRCPNCGEISCCNGNYCPNCGVHMKGATR